MNSKKIVDAMKQIVMIMIASLVIVGVTWQAGQSASVQQAFEHDERGGFEERENRPGRESANSQGRNRGQDGPQLNLRGIAGFSETIFKLVFVMAFIILGQRLWDKRKQRNQKSFQDRSTSL